MKKLYKNLKYNIKKKSKQCKIDINIPYDCNINVKAHKNSILPK